MFPTELRLHIIDNKCRCGHSWTHSYPLCAGQGAYGGRPTPQEEYKLEVRGITRSTHHYCHCYRCAPLGLNVGWEQPLEVKPPLVLDYKPRRGLSSRLTAHRKRQTLSEVEDEIFGDPTK